MHNATTALLSNPPRFVPMFALGLSDVRERSFGPGYTVTVRCGATDVCGCVETDGTFIAIRAYEARS